jgi:AcrR family transcriptional regulator
VQYGYGGMTMRGVVERAGLSRGAQVHHFATKAILVTDAIARLADNWSAEMLARIEAQPPARRSVPALLDALWEGHSGPLFEAVVELWVAGRTDPELRAALLTTQRELVRTVNATTRRYLAEVTEADNLQPAVETVLATLQGLALRSFLFGDDTAARQRAWSRVRGELIVLFNRAV